MSLHVDELTPRQPELSAHRVYDRARTTLTDFTAGRAGEAAISADLESDRILAVWVGRAILPRMTILPLAEVDVVIEQKTSLQTGISMTRVMLYSDGISRRGEYGIGRGMRPGNPQPGTFFVDKLVHDVLTNTCWLDPDTAQAVVNDWAVCGDEPALFGQDPDQAQ